MLSASDKLFHLLLAMDEHLGDDPPAREKAVEIGLASYLQAEPKRAGEVLKEIRFERDLSMREVASMVGVSYSHLGRVERGERKGRPDMTLIGKLASTYAIEIDRLLRVYGIYPVGDRFTRPSDPTIRERFDRLVLRDELRPRRMDRKTLDFVPQVLQEAWLEFAELLEAHLRAGGPSVREMQSEPVQDADDDEEGAGD